MVLARSSFVKFYPTPVGEFAIVISEEANQILASGFSDNLDHLAQIAAIGPLKMRHGTSQVDPIVEHFLYGYFEQKSDSSEIAGQLNIKGSRFQLDVWNTLSKVPFGAKITYKELAEKAGYKNAYRAAGTACGMNHHALIIPCHRAIHSNGQTGSYRWGSKIKQFLLDHENSSNPHHG